MPTDWPAILPMLKAEQASGLGVRAIAQKHGLPPGSVSRWLAKFTESVNQETSDSVKRVADTEQARVNEVLQSGTGSSNPNIPSPPLHSVNSQPAPSWLEREREKARALMGRTLSGEFDPSAQQSAMIKLALKDELEPEMERNLYAGRGTDELAERALVLAVSTIGLQRVAKMLGELGRAGVLDMGLDFAPQSNGVGESEATPPVTRPEEVQTIDGAIGTVTVIAPTVTVVSKAYEVETLE